MRKCYRYTIPHPPLGLVWTVMLVWRKGNINRTVSVYCVAFQQCTLHNHNEQFFQVGLLDPAWSHWVALSPPSTSVSSDFMMLCKCLKNYTNFTLPCRGLGLVGLALYLMDWPTIVLQCLTVDTLGWVIWPVKIVPTMTYNVFGGTLNPTLLLLLNLFYITVRFVSNDLP